MPSDPRPVVHIITRLEPGGSSRNALDSAAWQSSSRKVALIYGPCEGKERLDPPSREGLRCIEVPHLTREISPLRDLRAFLALRRLISELDPAIVHTHTAKAGVLGRWAAALSRRGSGPRPLVVHTPHGHVFYGYFGPFKSFFFLLVERLTALVTDRFIALTEGERKESLARGLGSAGDWTVIHSGVSLSGTPEGNARPEFGIAPGETVIATAARLEPVKGVEFFVRAAADLVRTDGGRGLRFLVIGDGSQRGSLERLAGELGLGRALIFAGFRRDALRCMSAADIYVQPSLNEAMGRTVIEAQYLGLPVVASNVCGLPDAVAGGISGSLVPPGDAEALAGAVRALVRDPGLRKRMGEAGRRRILEKDETGFPRFSAESMNARLLKFYNEVLGGPSA